MPLHTESRRRERILLYGPWGAGKSYSWVRLANWLHKTKSPNKIYLLDADHAFDAQCEAFPEFEEVVVPYRVTEWKHCEEAIRAFNMQGQRDDWLVVDRIDNAWESVQNSFTEQVYGKNLSTYFVDAKKRSQDEMANALGGAHGEKWGIINKMYSNFFSQVLNWQGHSIWCAGVKGWSDNDDPALVKIYQRHGLRPSGQKDLGKSCLTAIQLQPKGDGFIYTSVKDLHRELQTGQPMNDFVLDYLVKVAKWKLA